MTKAVEKVKIHDGVTKDGNNEFDECDSPTSHIIADGVESISSEMLFVCANLKSIAPGTFIGDAAFSVCRSLKSEEN